MKLRHEQHGPRRIGERQTQLSLAEWNAHKYDAAHIASTIRAPKMLPGHLVYSQSERANEPVIDVYYDMGGFGSLSGWRVSTPFLRDEETAFSPARATAPTRQFEMTGSNNWRQAGELPPTVSDFSFPGY